MFSISSIPFLFILFISVTICACGDKDVKHTSHNHAIKATPKASEILGNPEYMAISYGGYRHVDHSIEPTMDELKEDLHILSAMGVRMLRTYKLHKPHASNLVKAISEIKKENPEFEMYVMLGVWINCADAFTEHPNHEVEDSAANKSEIDKAVALAQAYPEVIKVIAVGNEAMVKWATSYYVQPGVILRWVNHLQELKKSGALPKDLWITSSDNFASWGGGGEEYHVDELTRLIQAVDFISLHTYPMHDTHYNPAFWGTKPEDASLSLEEKIEVAMQRALEYAQFQFQSTEDYVKRLGIEKPIHIGETGWASYSNGHYGDAGSKATDEYKEAIYYGLLRDWTNVAGISCFYFEAFDEVWKDAANPGGSENHFGLITVDGKAKFALWDLVDQGIFEHCTRGGNPITKTFQGDRTALIASLELPPTMKASSD